MPCRGSTCQRAKKNNTETDGESESDGEPISLDRITIAAIDRGLTIDAIRSMELGQIVDYCLTWNEIHDESDDDSARSKPSSKRKEVKKRKATQADWDAFFA